MAQKYIKDITPKCSAFNLTFEVFKRVTDTETGSVYQISDQTGTCKLRLKPDLVKFIQEGKVYTASNLLPFLQNHLLILELAKDIGSLVKEPFILPFKDHSFDLSAVEWKAEKQIAKIESESIETKPTESEKSSSTLNSSSRVQPKHKPHSKVQIQTHKPYSKREYQTNRSHHNVQSSIRKPQPKVEHQTNKPRDTKKKPSYIEKFSEQEEPNRSKVTTKPSFIKLLNLKGFQEKELVDVIVYVSNITEIEKQSWGKWTRFIECRLSDGTGSARGLFFGNTKIQNKQYYEFRNLRLKYVGGKIELQETKETTIRVSSSASFQPNPRQVEVHDSKY